MWETRHCELVLNSTETTILRPGFSREKVALGRSIWIPTNRTVRCVEAVTRSRVGLLVIVEFHLAHPLQHTPMTMHLYSDQD